MKYYLTLASVCLFILSCGSTKKIPEQKDLNEVVVSSKSSEYKATEPRHWDIVHTDISLSPFQKINDSFTKEAKGTVMIKMHPYFYATDSLALDAKSMKIDKVMITKPYPKTLKYNHEDDKLIIKFDREFFKTDTIELGIEYTAKPYAENVGGSSAISEDRGLYYININNEIPNKPQQIWTQGETQSNSHWFPTLDQPNEKFTLTLSLLVPENLQTLSNGKLVSSKQEKSGWKIDKWEMNQPIQTYAVMFAIGNFAIVKDKEWKGKEVSYYVEPEYAPYAKKMFKNTPEMMEYFSEITGVDYPWSKYSQIVVRDYVSGAMENTSASLFGEFMNQNARENDDKDYEDIVSHELFHQWFGDYVTAESWSNLTLNESFATYGQQLWRKHKYGRVSNDEMAFNDLAAYLGQAETDDPPLVRYYYNNREDMFDRISYQKGGAILRYLHGLIGDSAFYMAMNNYLTKHAYDNAEAGDWRHAVEEVTGADWSWFFNQWYYRGGHPNLRIDYTYDAAKQELQVNTLQTDSTYTYKLPLKAKLVYGNEMQEIDWNIQKRKQTFTYPYKNGVRPLFIPDTEHWLVGTIKESKGTKEWLQQLQVSDDDYLSKRRSISGAFFEQQDSLSQTIFLEALNSKIEPLKLYALTLLRRMPDKFGWRSNFKNEVMMLAINGNTNKVRAAAIDVIGSWKIESSKNDLLNALDDSSYIVQGAALEALSSIDSTNAYTNARRIASNGLQATTPAKRIGEGVQDAVFWQLAKAGVENDFSLFESMATTVNGRKKISLSQTIYIYSLRTKDDAVFEKALKLLVGMASTESIKSYRYSIGASVFEINNYYQDAMKEKNNKFKTIAESRLPIVEKYKNQILSTEKDSENLYRYKQL